MSWRDDLNYGLAAFGLKIPGSLPIDDWGPRITSRPARNTAVIVSSAAALFLIAERPHNPNVRDIYDALLYCSSAISVGHSEIQPLTPVGKVIGSILMAYGPALAEQSLDGRSNAVPGNATQEQILTTLQEILTTLRCSSPAPTASGATEETNE